VSILRRSRGRIRRITAGTAVALLVAVTAYAAPALADPQDDQQDDPELQQQIDPDQEVAEDETVLDLGHVDMGPRFQDGEWTLMVHDDTELAGSVWRYLDRTVVQVLDASQVTVPEDEEYSFLGAEPGEKVHVVPQTQNTDVVWLGWNTQDPEVMDQLDRGVTLTMGHVTGPGDLLVYLQAGGFGEPDVLWDSREASGQDLWVDVNTHTHANWVFTEPGVYLVEITATADLIDGETVSDTQYLRFAVGDETDAQEAMTAEPEKAPEGSDGANTEDDGESAISSAVWWIALTVVIVLLLATVVVVVVVRARRAKRRALSER